MKQERASPEVCNLCRKQNLKRDTLDFVHLQQKGVGMNEPLVDADGYPRADVDIYQVRTARHNIICKQPVLHFSGRFKALSPPDSNTYLIRSIYIHYPNLRAGSPRFTNICLATFQSHSSA